MNEEYLLLIAKIDSNCAARATGSVNDCDKPISVGEEFAWQRGVSMHVRCATKLNPHGIILKPGPSVYGM